MKQCSESVVCMNNAACNDDNTGCDCTEGFSGSMCEIGAALPPGVTAAEEPSSGSDAAADPPGNEDDLITGFSPVIDTVGGEWRNNCIW